MSVGRWATSSLQQNPTTQKRANRPTVAPALDAYVLEGAKLAKRTDSCSYEMWTEALIMLGNIANARYEAAEIDDATREMMLLVIEAQEQLWADMRVNA